MSYFFFFSSRRRHTRLQGDWSSDVWSSDLSGASDVLDLRYDGLDHLRFAIERAHSRQLAREIDRETISAQREVLQELLKDLIQTERRSIDLEYDLAKAAGTLAELPPAPALRQPSVMVIDRDRALLKKLE